MLCINCAKKLLRILLRKWYNKLTDYFPSQNTTVINHCMQHLHECIQPKIASVTAHQWMLWLKWELQCQVDLNGKWAHVQLIA